MPVNKKYMCSSVAIALLLCMAQVSGNRIVILGVLACFLLMLAWACIENYTIPLLLFFLPWSSILRLSTDSFSFFTFGLVMVSFLSMVKKKFRFKNMYLATGFLLLLITLLAKLINGSFISFAYVAFMMLIFIFPVIKEEYREAKYDYFHMVIFLSAGAAIAAISARLLMHSPNIRAFITVKSYLNITRMTGFYEDPNFYVAQITAALGGCFYLILRERNKHRIVLLAAFIVILLYCGILSGSKSFVLVLALILLLWLCEIIRMRGRHGFKLFMIVGAVLLAIYVATSALFGGWIEVLVTRFSFITDISSLTTKRTDIWANYFREIFGNVRMVLLGEGFSNTMVAGHASHNTLIQIVYEFGLVGLPVLLVWIAYFFRDTFGSGKLHRGEFINILMVITGAILPWMAIDILYFDEFFLFQMYVFVAMQEMRVATPTQPQLDGQKTAKHRGARLRFVWRA